MACHQDAEPTGSSFAVRAEYHCWAALGATRPAKANRKAKIAIRVEIEAFIGSSFLAVVTIAATPIARPQQAHSGINPISLGETAGIGWKNGARRRSRSAQKLGQRSLQSVHTGREC